MGLENPTHLLFIGIVALLVLGPRRLPELARALGHGLREFREAMGHEDERRGEAPIARAEPIIYAEPTALHPAGPQAEGPSATDGAPPAGGAAVDPAQGIRSDGASDRGPL